MSDEEVPSNVPSHTTLDNLKKEARRWLKALRSNDENARARLRRFYPDAPAEPSLRHIQHALALEHGFAGWTALKQQLGTTPAADTHASRVAWFLEEACPDWRLGGPGAQAAARAAALRILNRHPEIARDSIHTAAVCGELGEVERILSSRPQAASEPGGPKQWQPLHYLCFARLPLAAADRNAVAIARALLDRGADPNAPFQIGNASHSPLVGVIGEGEERRQPHPQAKELIPLLLDRGANPCDTQVFYNVSMGDAACRWLDLLYEHSVKIGRQGDWTDPAATRFGPLSALDWMLGHVVSRGDRQCAEWLLARGANPSFGAAPAPGALSEEDQFVAACLRLDHDRVHALLHDHPEFLHSPAALFGAAERDRADVVEYLLDLGVAIEIENPQRQRALHIAAGANALRVAQLLIDRSAEVDPRESQWGGTPLSMAIWGARREMIDLLSRYTRDVFELASLAKAERLRQLLREQPELAKAKDTNGATPLMWMREDAPEIIELFLEHGADPSARLEDGRTAADLLERRGLEDAANALRWRERNRGADAGVASFLRLACLDWRSGGPERNQQMYAAARLLRRHPEIARDSIYTAVACGDLDHVMQILASRPQAAAEPGGPRGWPPLLYLCSARLPFPEAGEYAVEIAEALLDRGADPNVHYPGGNPTIHYSALTCVMGRGEEQASMHPQAQALAELLLERGAEPYDIQVLYNVFAGHASQRHLGDEGIWLMELIYRHSLARGRAADWQDPNWPMLNFGGGARYLLASAIAVNHRGLVEWLLAHGANPNAPPRPKGSQDSLYREAWRRGLTEIAELLGPHGAPTKASPPDDEEAFIAACLRLDRAAAQSLIARHPEYLQLPKPMQIAAQTDRADVAAFLIDLGMSPDVEDPQQGRARALHWAAYFDSPGVVQVLIDRGAEIDFFDQIHDGTALWWAFWGQKWRTFEMLSPLSRDVWSLAMAGKVDRLREVLRKEPRLAKVTYQGTTPLFRLPDGEADATEVVTLFLAAGTDPSIKDQQGMTAADIAERRGLDEAARLLRAAQP